MLRIRAQLARSHKAFSVAVRLARCQPLDHQSCEQRVVLQRAAVRGKLIALGVPEALKRDLHSHKLLQLETSDLLGAMRALESEPGVLDVAVFGAGLHVNVEDLAVGAGRIRRVLEQCQIRIKRLEPIQPSMEDVFVGLIEAEEQKNP